MSVHPDFDSLPKVKGQPHGNAWGLWGDEDELGSKSGTRLSHWLLLPHSMLWRLTMPQP